MEEDLSTYQQLQKIQNKQVKVPKIPPPNPQNSQCIRRWGMSRADRMTKYEEYGMDKQTELLNRMKMEESPESIPGYYYNANKVNPNEIVYQRNPKQGKGEKGVKEGKHTRAVKPVKFVFK